MPSFNHRLKKSRGEGALPGRIPRFETLEDRTLLAAEIGDSLIISEFLASNSDDLLDFEGDSSDWLEIYNPTGSAVDTDGWYLTDNEALLTKWEMPSVVIDPGETLVVFASGKNLTDTAGELHTNFQIGQSGEYLALVEADGTTIATQYTPEFPNQKNDISYGIAPTVAQTLVDASSEVSVFVPSDDSLGLTWTETVFNDSGWTTGTNAVGFENDTGYESLIELDLHAEMYDSKTSAYIRIPFTVADPNDFDVLSLRMKYDDGFAIYINGEFIISQNAPGTLTGTSAATGTHSDAAAVLYEHIDISVDVGELQAGDNVLAIHGLNRSTTSSDFLISAQLISSTTDHSTVEERFFRSTTPGAPNGSGVLGFVGDTQFSVDRGFYDTSFQLDITSSTPDATIMYTTDGSTPTESNGTVFNQSITIDTTSTIRAFAYKPGYESTNVDTQTYIFLNDVLTQTNTPAGYPSLWSGTYTADYEVDPEIVNHATYSSILPAAFQDIPSISIVTDIPNLFDPTTGIYQNPTESGVAWERPTSVEMINPDGTTAFQVNAGVRMQGGASRRPDRSPKHSFRLLFKDEYGPTKLRYPLFGETATEEFDTITLRAGYNLTWIHPNHTSIGEQRALAQYVRDQFARENMMAMGQVASHGTYVHLYVNGMYWGMYNPVERPDASFAATYFGGDKDEYDALNRGEAVDGDLVAWNEMLAISRGGLASDTAYQAIQQYLDVESFADYMLMNLWAGNVDWPHNNWYAARKREAGAQFHFFSWDTESSLIDVNEDRKVNIDPANSPGELFQDLRQNADFRALFADRVQLHMFNDGALTTQNLMDRFQNLLDKVELPVVAESARWGDYRRDVNPTVNGPFDLYERDVHWVAETNRLMTSYFPQRNGIVLQQFQNAGLFSAIDAPVFNQHGGHVAQGFQVTLTNPGGDGDMYYMLDGSDPRLPGGGLNSSAILYPGPSIIINQNTTVIARVLDGGNWSAAAVGEFAITVPADASNLSITELNYNPYAPDAGSPYNNDDFEFVELLNTSANDILLTGVEFTEGIQFAFSAGSVPILAAGQRVLVVSNLAAFSSRYDTTGLNIAGEYTGSLSNSGERLRLKDANLLDIYDFEFNDAGSWPGRADGAGSSLQIIDTTGDYDDGDNWRSSILYGGSPGAAALASYSDIVINEVLTHTDLPSTDAIELLNTTTGVIDISGWYLSDERGVYKKFQIPDNTILAPGDYVIFDEDDFNSSAGVDPTDFALSASEGDDVYLLQADASGNLTLFADHVEFGAAANGVSFGRWPNATGPLYPMVSVTLGAENSGPKFGPVVISEVMYNPPDPGGSIDPNNLEFVEIVNTGTTSQNIGGWTLDKGIDFEFPSGVVLAPQDVLVVLPFDPDLPANAQLVADFLAIYSIDSSVELIGGYTGQLSNGGEKVQLLYPDDPPVENPLLTPMILVDELSYDDVAPWPLAPDGTGPSLNRTGPYDWGMDSASWFSDTATPGTALNLVLPTVAAGDNSGDSTDASVQFTTALSQFRTGVSDSNYVRPAFPDSLHYVDVINNGLTPLTIFETQVNAPDVSIDVVLTSSSADDIVLQPGESHRIMLTYAPTVPTPFDQTEQDFSMGNGLVVLSDASNQPMLQFTLTGTATFNSDTSYDGNVNFAELGIMNASFGLTDSDPDYDPTADINGDGIINFADFGPFNVEFGRQLSVPAFASSTPEAPSPKNATEPPQLTTTSVLEPMPVSLAVEDSSLLEDDSDVKQLAEEMAAIMSYPTNEVIHEDNPTKQPTPHDTFFADFGNAETEPMVDLLDFDSELIAPLQPAR